MQAALSHMMVYTPLFTAMVKCSSDHAFEALHMMLYTLFTVMVSCGPHHAFEALLTNALNGSLSHNWSCFL